MNLSKHTQAHTQTQLYTVYKWETYLPQKLFPFQKITSNHMSTTLKTFSCKSIAFKAHQATPVSVPLGLNSPSGRDATLCHHERSFAKSEPPLAEKTSQ